MQSSLVFGLELDVPGADWMLSLVVESLSEASGLAHEFGNVHVPFLQGTKSYPLW